MLGDGVQLGAGCRLEALEGTLRLGARTVVGPRAFVVSLAGMEVGEDCTIGDFAGVGVPGAPGRVGPRDDRRGVADRGPRDGRVRARPSRRGRCSPPIKGVEFAPDA